MEVLPSRKFDEYRQVENSISDTEEDETSSSGSDISFGKVYRNIIPDFKPVKTRGELDIDDLPLVGELKISVEKKELVKIGHIHATVTKQVVVKAIKEQKALDIDTVLFISCDKPLGRIFEVFGPVIEPFYVVLFDSPEVIKDKNITVGDDVYFAPAKQDITKYVFVDLLQQQKGSDASWKDNNEPPEEHLDYSDDEQERAAKLKRKKENQSEKESTDNEVIYIPPPKPLSFNSSAYLNNPISESRFNGKNFNMNRPTTQVSASPQTDRICGLRLRPFQPFIPTTRNDMSQQQVSQLRLNSNQNSPMNVASSRHTLHSPSPRPLVTNISSRPQMTNVPPRSQMTNLPSAPQITNVPPRPQMTAAPMFNSSIRNHNFGAQYQFVPASYESRFMVVDTLRGIASPLRPVSPYYVTPGFGNMPIFGTQPQQNLAANYYRNGPPSSNSGYTSPLPVNSPISYNPSNSELRPYEANYLRNGSTSTNPGYTSPLPVNSSAYNPSNSGLRPYEVTTPLNYGTVANLFPSQGSQVYPSNGMQHSNANMTANNSVNYNYPPRSPYSYRMPSSR